MSMRRNIVSSLKRRLLRLRLGSKNFTIVSNNCWGAHVYQQLGISYQTPFIGTFIAPGCFLKLVENFRWYMNQPLTFVDSSRHEHINIYRAQKNLNYPIGVLGEDVEIQFLHYQSEADAVEKWNRRLQRISDNDEDVFFKFCDRELCTTEQIATFDHIAVKNKVCFVSVPVQNIKTAVWIPESEEHQVVDGLMLSSISPQYFDTAGWINGGSGKPGLLRPFLCV